MNGVEAVKNALKWYTAEICGPTLASRAYVENAMVGQNVTAELPEVTPQTIDIEAMGPMSLPMWHRLEDMEFKITKIGTDKGLGAMLSGQKLNIELRWAQQAADPYGNLREFGCKAFVTGVPKILPGTEVTPGETSENEMTYAVFRYKLYVDEEELINIDRFANKCVIAGVDYAKSIEKFL